MLSIKNLYVSVNNQPILKGVNLNVQPGEIHAVMGPNGSGKSTLANSLAGHPFYEVTKGKVLLDENNVLDQSPDERSNSGLFLAFQYPVEVSGVNTSQFLRLARNARFSNQPKKQFSSLYDFRKFAQGLADELAVDPKLLDRGLNEGFSGGEKKRVEILQMAVLEPKYAILDETDSGLDVDAIKAVSAGVRKIIKKYQTGIIVITHYQRILKYLKPDHVHVMVDGRIVQSGGKEFARELEKEGYKRWQLATSKLPVAVSE